MTMSIGGYSGVSSTSFAQMRQQMFQSLDADSSGAVDETEFAKGPSGSGGMDSGVASALFSAFDTDSSGGLSQDELESGFQKLSSSMRSVLIGAQDASGAAGADGPPPPPGPPPGQSSSSDSSSSQSSSSDSGLDQLLALLRSVSGGSTSGGGTDSGSTESDSDSAAATVRNDFKTLMNDLLKLTQQGGSGTQATA